MTSCTRGILCTLDSSIWRSLLIVLTRSEEVQHRRPDDPDAEGGPLDAMEGVAAKTVAGYASGGPSVGDPRELATRRSTPSRLIRGWRAASAFLLQARFDFLDLYQDVKG